MTPSKVLLFFLLSFVGGVFVASFFEVPKIIICELLILGTFYSLVFFKQKAILVFGICLLVLGLAISRTGSIEKPERYRSAERGYFPGLKQKLEDVVEQNLSPPQSSILSAILLGNQHKISESWREKLNIAGVRHITAISGMHIVILSSILLWLGIASGLYRGQAFYFAVGLIWLFILMIGFQPSAIRAGIMGSIFLFCEKIGRQKTADRALLLTAAIMLAINPSLLRYNIGFQLSFLATLGIIYLMPIFQTLFSKLKLPKFDFGSLRALTSIIAMTLAAQVFTLPILIYNFGYFSAVSPITNILIVPLLPYLMGVGFLFLIAGAIFQPLALIFLFPVWLLLSYLTKIVDLFAGLSFSSITFHISWLWLPLFYSALALLLWQIKKRQRLKLLP